MRAFFLLLVLANLVFFAYATVALEGSSSESRIPQLQVAAERIKLLNATERAPADKPQVPGKVVPPAPRTTADAWPAACLEWGIFAGPGVARAERALASLELPEGQVERTVTDAGGYWVYMPPLKNKAEVDRKVRELRDFGVTEFFVVQDAGQWRNAISLGIFRTDEAAQAFRAGLKQRGVRSAIVTRRANFLKQVAFHVREPGAETVARLTLIQQEFPGSEMKAGPCPPAATAAKG
ncbi:MAG: SPOR domain-containing protein [Burkholderiales bacterium]